MAGSRVTLTDVAREAGVGVATVSRALNGRADVSAETIDRVRAAATSLGYRPSVTARALRRGSFNALSVIVSESVWGWWEPVLRAAANAAAEAGFQLFIHPVSTAEGSISELIDGLADVPTEGVIAVSVTDQAEVREACARIGLPVVAIDDSSHSILLATVAADNRAGAREMTRHLLALGHRRIAFVGGSTEELAPAWGEGLFVEERLAGYRDALEEAGLAADELVIGWSEPDEESRAIVEALSDVLESGVVPDAIFCVADLVAARVLRTLDAHGLRAPEDVSVVGFDDERAAVLLSPRLTTMRQPYGEMGRLAVELLRQAIAGEDLAVERHTLPTTLVERDSTRRRTAP
ncbi:MAG: LacI family transcriptional regulator [Microbacterium sp.]|jgi:LacI family transcriptional regulator|nr:LacI family transcriptional regulator [Microbacterium sp.]